MNKIYLSFIKLLKLFFPDEEPEQIPPIEEIIQEDEPVQEKTIFEEIAEQADSLTWYDSDGNISTKITAKAIERWILDNINYNFYYYPRGVKVTWKEREGDCTERALLAEAMFRSIGIRSVLKHGYTDGEKHDWIEVEGYKLFYYGNTTEIGDGVW